MSDEHITTMVEAAQAHSETCPASGLPMDNQAPGVRTSHNECECTAALVILDVHGATRVGGHGQTITVIRMLATALIGTLENSELDGADVLAAQLRTSMFEPQG